MRKHLADIFSVLAQTTSSPGAVRSELVQECRRLKLCSCPFHLLVQSGSTSADRFGHLGPDINRYYIDACLEQDKDMTFIIGPYSCDCEGDCVGNCRDRGSDSEDDSGSDSEDDYGSECQSECGHDCESDSSGEFDGDRIKIDGVRAFPTYGPGFSFNPATDGTEEEYNRVDELAMKLARDVCEYNNCIKDVDQQLVFKQLIKAIVYPQQHFFITLEATHMGNLKVVQTECLKILVWGEPTDS
ncbi:hypothetical protein Tsubulata_008641 [Turnera subulata]|uniref:Uncharacterized protein n=1 Tax=Turnera subulata TaxID=218843 RepID=A0A9Q0FIY7_9ROSI|nr:hypothetical protein Tsubulata_008641 [Turnera subulata]